MAWTSQAAPLLRPSMSGPVWHSRSLVHAHRMLYSPSRVLLGASRTWPFCSFGPLCDVSREHRSALCLDIFVPSVREIPSGAGVLLAGMSVLDLCCSPGAKLCAILDCLQSKGILHGVDESPDRLALCRNLLEKHRRMAADAAAAARQDADDASAGDPDHAARCTAHVQLFLGDGTRFMPPLQLAAKVDGAKVSSGSPAAKTSSSASHPHAAKAACAARLFFDSKVSDTQASRQGRKRRNKSARAREAKLLKSVEEGAAATTTFSTAAAVSTASYLPAPHEALRGAKPDTENRHHRELPTAGRGVEVVAMSPSSAQSQGSTLYDRVLVDAECSHDGSVRHLRKTRPDLLPTLFNPMRCQELVRLQKALLEHGFRLLKPGGLLVYSTCSLTRSQNEGVVQWFLNREPAAVVEPSGFARELRYPTDPARDVAESRERCFCEETTEVVEEAACASVSSTNPNTWRLIAHESEIVPETLRFLPSYGTSGLFVARIRKATES